MLPGLYGEACFGLSHQYIRGSPVIEHEANFSAW